MGLSYIRLNGYNRIGGYNHAGEFMKNVKSVVQMVEHDTLNVKVTGSTPVRLLVGGVTRTMGIHIPRIWHK